MVVFDRTVFARVFANSSPRLRPDLEARLRAIDAPDLAVLSSLIDRDLSSWQAPHPRSLRNI